MPDVRDRQTSDAHYRLMPPTAGGITNVVDQYVYKLTDCAK